MCMMRLPRMESLPLFTLLCIDIGKHGPCDIDAEASNGADPSRSLNHRVQLLCFRS
jgi:hypothetical protein